MAIDFIVGVLISALSGMGVGGGGLLVMYLVLVKNMGQVQSQAVNLVFFVIASAVAIFYHRKKRKIDFRTCGILIASGIAGAVIGAFAANITEPGILRKIFGWTMLVSGLISLLKEVKNVKNKK